MADKHSVNKASQENTTIGKTTFGTHFAVATIT